MNFISLKKQQRKSFNSSGRDFIISINNQIINNHEIPVEEKLLSGLITETEQEEGAQSFWSAALKLPLQSDRIVAWKFCHVLHKVLREGHSQVVGHSQMHKGMIEDLGKLWSLSQDGYGRLIQHYTNFLVTKLDFHRRNALFPGNLVVTEEELESIGENDINNHFQLSIEIFDYLDGILTLQSVVFGSLDMSRNSMMLSGQCRLAPLIPCIQDSSRLYDYCVKILFRLHSSLPPDTLIGHRERFLKQFKTLGEFYITANNLQYFKNLIQIPLLPDNPPNFSIEAEVRAEFRAFNVEPSVPVEEEESDESGSFSGDDFSDTTSTYNADFFDSEHRTGFILPEQIAERDNFIQQLQNEAAELKETIQQSRMEFLKRTEELINKVAELKTDLADKDGKLLKERQLKEVALRQTEELRNKVEKLEENLAVKNSELWQERPLKEVALRQREELRNKIEKLEENLAVKNSELWQERHLKENLLRQAEEEGSNFQKQREELIDRIATLEAALAIKNIELRQERQVEEDLFGRTGLGSEFRKGTAEELSNKIAKLERQLDFRNRELLQERHIKEVLQRQMEERAKTTEERLQKLNAVYTKLRKELLDKIWELQTDLAIKTSEERQLKEDLLRVRHTEEASKYLGYGKRDKTMEEKFLRLKDVYTKLREEYIQLIRTKAEVDKQLVIAKQSSEYAVRVKEELSAQLSELLHEKSKSEETLVKSGEIANKLAFLKAEKEAVENEKAFLRVAETIETRFQLTSVDKQLVMSKQSSEYAVRVKEELSAQLNKSLFEESKIDENLVKHEEIPKIRFSELKKMFENEKAIKN